jgi:hypothetical protein
LLPLQNVLAHVALPRGAAAKHTARKISLAQTATNFKGAKCGWLETGAGTCVIEHLVDGLADPMRLAVASRVGGDASHIQIGFRC